MRDDHRDLASRICNYMCLRKYMFVGQMYQRYIIMHTTFYLLTSTLVLHVSCTCILYECQMLGTCTVQLGYNVLVLAQAGTQRTGGTWYVVHSTLHWPPPRALFEIKLTEKNIFSAPTSRAPVLYKHSLMDSWACREHFFIGLYKSEIFFLIVFQRLMP